MLYERKTKDPNFLKVIWFPFLLFGSFFITASLAGFGPAFYVIGGITFLASMMPFITFWKTRNSGYLAVFMWLMFLFLASVSTPSAIAEKSQAGLIILFLVGMYISMLTVAYMTFNRKLRWRGQEVFELAALSVEDLGDSFSARPRPVGQVPISKTEMIRFVDFMTRNLIAFAFREENRVIFVLGLPGKDTRYLLGLKKDYLDDTWVAIDYDGNVTVNIIEKDYLLFKQDLDFDQLCQSMGNVIAEFLELSKQGQNSQIIDRMNALRLNPFL